ncbi:non-ribosomal peptide synthetase [Chitinophaga sp.]|uniref:non-ribosomal peptide synthetase n=1 Tax=Chitinophaga sp. TaxID=1869181 RepID=UPI002B76E864|nr:non-ribosomal peptide synthetase [Chitinophaga sp.]HWV69856.1 amino acid adenylation domain-containing protein [Chitinophaga sp.]
MNGKVEIKDIYGLSPMQQNMLMHALDSAAVDQYHRQVRILMHGDVDPEVVNLTLNNLVERHDILRTVFAYEGLSRPRQIVTGNRQIPVYYNDLESLPDYDKLQHIDQYKQKDRQQRFDITGEPLLRLAIFKIGTGTYEFVWSYHHIILDGWSIVILIREFGAIYDSIVRGIKYQLPEGPAFKHFIRALANTNRGAAIHYWSEYLDGYQRAASLPFSPDRRSKKGENKEVKLLIGKKEATALRQMAINTGVTLNTLIQCTWGVLLAKYNSAEEAVFGCVVSGRALQGMDFEEAVGLFINTIPRRVRFDRNESLGHLCRRMQQSVIQSEEYSYFPLTEIQSLSPLKNRLIDHVLVFENMPASESLYGAAGKEWDSGLKMGRLMAEHHTSYDLSVTVFPEDSIRIVFSYNSEHYGNGYIERLSGHFQNLLFQLTGEGDVMIDSLRLLNKEEEEAILKMSLGPQAAYVNCGLMPLLQEVFVKSGTAICVRHGNKTTTYAEVDHLSSSLAGFLQQEMGVKKGDRVALMMDRSADMLVALLAIMKCGAAFVPVDIQTPEERMKHVLHAAACRCLISEREHDTGGAVWIYNKAGYTTTTYEAKETIISGDDLLYILFTSGTSGEPKGVKIHNKSAINYFCWANDHYFDAGARYNFAFFTSLSFDLTLTSIFTTLLRGDTLVVFDSTVPVHDTLRAIFSPGADIQAVKLVPSHVNILNHIKPGSNDVRLAILGGENLTPGQINVLREMDPSMRIFNEYGPTEATVGCSCKEVGDAAAAITVGRPVSNTRLLVLDKSLHIQPVGALGELCIAGHCLSTGYLDDTVTAKRFQLLDRIGEQLIYRSGDAARWTDDGELILSGRMDNQIKLNGYRIEPDEIAVVLGRMNGIKSNVVRPLSIHGEMHLAVYYELMAGKDISDAAIRSYLALHLPEYMLPQFCIRVETMPLNINGKIDVEQLPVPGEKRKMVVMPVTGLEQQLQRIWADILLLPAEELSVTEDIFLLGGNSLKVISFVLKVQDTLQKSLSISDVFENRTVQDMAQLIEKMEGTKPPVIEKAEAREYYRQSAAQRRLFILNELDKSSLSYNISAGFRINGPLDTGRVENAFRSLIAKHTILRTAFFEQEGIPVQKVFDECAFSIDLFDEVLSDSREAEQAFFRPFVLDKPPLLRAMLIKEAPEQYKFIVDMHHIVCDGISINLFVDDFIRAYKQDTLLPNRLEYYDYAEWNVSRFGSASYQAHGKFWKEQLAGYTPHAGLPADFRRQAVRETAGKLRHYELTQEETARLRKISEASGVSMYTLLLTCISVVIAKLSNEEEVVIGTSVSGRNNIALEGIIGMFVNTMAMRIHVDPDKPFADLLRDVKQLVLKALEHQEYAFEDLLGDLSMQFDAARNPLFDVMFVLQEDWEPAFELPGLIMESVQVDKGVAKFDLTIECIDKGDFLSFNLEYATTVFKEEKVDRLMDCLRTLVADIGKSTGRGCAALDWVPAKEKDKILFQFNNTAAPYSSACNIHQLVEKQVALSAGRTAVTTGDSSISYEALNSTANRIAASVAEICSLKGIPVGIFLERSIEMIAAVLGVLKAGDVYVPLELQQPDQRIGGIIRSIGIGILVTDGHHLDRVSQLIKAGHCTVGVVICLSPEKSCGEALAAWAHSNIKLLTWEDVAKQNGENVDRMVAPDDYAYIIHTSGSSGVPKGVLVKHQPVVNTLEWVNKSYAIDSSHKLLFLTSLGFDLSVYDIFGILMAGATIRLAKQEEVTDPARLTEILFNEDITFWDSAPAALQQILPCLREDRFKNRSGKLKRVFLSGDWVPLTIKEDLAVNFKDVAVTALGGATEAAIWSNFFDIDAINSNWSSIPYGKPIQNARYYVLDQSLNCCAIGTPGDLYIGGRCLATGYVNDIALTRSKFLPNPFEKGEIFYKTGDRARWFEDGNLEFLGRMDSQVKLRGYRIELGEIETWLRKYPGIGEAVADIRKMGTDRKLCAYFTATREVNTSALRDYLTGVLPQYMVPSYFMMIDQIPVTINGKLNRKALPEIRQDAENDRVAPADDMEQTLVEICGGIINIPSSRIGMNMSFAQLGGTSIDAMKLVSGIEKRLSVRLRLLDILRLNHISEIAVLVKTARLLTVNNAAAIEGTSVVI